MPQARIGIEVCARQWMPKIFLARQCLRLRLYPKPRNAAGSWEISKSFRVKTPGTIAEPVYFLNTRGVLTDPLARWVNPAEGRVAVEKGK